MSNFSSKFRKVSLPFSNYEILYLYTDWRFFGQNRNQNQTKKEFLDEVIIYLLGVTGTLIIPTFTYTKDGVYNCKTTPTKLGALNSHFVGLDDVVRSDHPIFSFAAIGNEAEIVLNIGKSAFGDNSIHARLLNKKTAFLYLGKPVFSGNTIIHFIEQRQQVKYRFEKIFNTQVFCGENFVGSNFSAFVRKDEKNHNYYFDFKKSYNSLTQNDLIKEVNFGVPFSNFSLIDFESCYEVLFKLLKQDPLAFVNRS